MERALAVAGFSALWAGDGRHPADLIPECGAAEAAALSLARRGRAEQGGDGRVVGLHGLTLRPTRHRFAHRGRTHQTWCAFDAIGIPAALALDAEAHTDCPTCAQPLSVRIRRGEPEAWRPLPAARDNDPKLVHRTMMPGSPVARTAGSGSP